ncbi:YadA-like family protein [Proteus penneri]|nr:YadA-like family protein [Proteus penneri]
MDTDAVNVKQLKDHTALEITNNNKVINQRMKEVVQLGQKAANNAERNANDYTDAKFNQIDNRINSSFQQLNDKIDENAKKANAGIASVAAMTNIPYVNYQKFSVGAGLGNYRNGNAIAVGMQYKLNENTHVRASTSWNSSDSAVFGGGIAIGW